MELRLEPWFFSFKKLNHFQICEKWKLISYPAAAAAAKSLQSCLTLCDSIDGSPPGSAVPGILQARILEWVAISFSNAWKWSRSVVSDSSRPHGLQSTRLLCPWDFPGKSTGVGCHCLLWFPTLGFSNVDEQLNHHILLKPDCWFMLGSELPHFWQDPRCCW